VPSDQMDGAFRKAQGDYIHQQGPAPQQLEHDGAATSSPPSARRSARARSRAWRRPASGSAPTWPSASCAPIARRARG
jgi:hypothetical protein